MTHVYRFTLTVAVEADHKAYDDPEWIADAAWGSLSNEYGFQCVYGDIELLEEPSINGG